MTTRIFALTFSIFLGFAPVAAVHAEHSEETEGSHQEEMHTETEVHAEAEVHDESKPHEESGIEALEEKMLGKEAHEKLEVVHVAVEENPVVTIAAVIAVVVVASFALLRFLRRNRA